MKEQFEKLYADIVLAQGLPMTEEMQSLFDQILLEEFDDNPELMSAFIESIINKYVPPELSDIEKLQQENEELKARLEMSEGAILDLAEMLVTR